MERRTTTYLAYLLGTSLLTTAIGCNSGPARKLTLLYTNDEHSHLFGFGPEVDDFPTPTAAGTGTIQGGVARRQVVLVQERAAAQQAGADTLTVSAGDVSQGTLAQVGFTRGSDYMLLKSLGYDIACIGNHEFDYGPAALAQSITAAQSANQMPQLVASNLRFDPQSTADDSLAALFGEGREQKPIKRYHVMTTANGLKVGFFGILGSEAAYYAPFKTPVRGSGEYAEELDFATVRTKIYADIQPVVDTLRNVEKVDLVVALSHSGLNLDQPSLGDDYNFAQNISGIDVIISGHSHTAVPKPIVVQNTRSKKDVIIVQAGSFGSYVGRLPLTIQGNKVSYDVNQAELIAITDRIVPDPTTASVVSGVVDALETPAPPSTVSFLEGALSRILGTTVTRTSRPGDLYFYPLGHTDFDVVGERRFVETNMLNLSADAEFAAAQAALPTEPVDLVAVAAGSVRANLDKGKTGAITFGDAFRAFPLGFSPVDNTVGYPLVHAYLLLAEVKGAFEVSASLGLTNDSIFLGSSGVRVTVDTTRPAFNPSFPLDPNNGRVTKIEFDATRTVGSDTYDTVIFDVNRAAPWTSASFSSPLSLVHVATNLYIASFAASNGITLKNRNGQGVSLAETILHRNDGSEIKDYEAFASYLKQRSDANAGNLPANYDETQQSGRIPRRLACTGPLCGR